MTGRLPLHVLTGFLGSGKTTLLNRILSRPEWTDSAVLINEIGAIAIDHALVDRIEQGDAIDIVVLKGGCTCCALRGDMVEALRELYARRAAGDVPEFARVVLETTGLADPAPILYTLVADPVLRHKFERGTIVATVDSAHGLAQLRRHPEARKQVAMADRIVVTKTDMDDGEIASDLLQHVHVLNPAAALCDASHAATPETLLRPPEVPIPLRGNPYGSHKPGEGAGDAYGVDKSGYAWMHRDRNATQNVAPSRAIAKGAVFAELLGDERLQLEQSHSQLKQVVDSEHSQDIASIAFLLDAPVPWSQFSVWLTLLLHAHGAKILRFKALLDVQGWSEPVALDAVHHIVYAPRHLQRWPDGARSSRLVVIAQDLDVQFIAPSLRSFIGMNAQGAVMTNAG